MGIGTRGMRTQQHTNDPKAAIGYVRVSTQEQATGSQRCGIKRGLPKYGPCYKAP